MLRLLYVIVNRRDTDDVLGGRVSIANDNIRFGNVSPEYIEEGDSSSRLRFWLVSVESYAEFLTRLTARYRTTTIARLPLGKPLICVVSTCRLAQDGDGEGLPSTIRESVASVKEALRPTVRVDSLPDSCCSPTISGSANGSLSTAGAHAIIAAR